MLSLGFIKLEFGNDICRLLNIMALGQLGSLGDAEVEDVMEVESSPEVSGGKDILISPGIEQL